MTFPIQRFSIKGKSIFSYTRYDKKSIPCKVTIRDVLECEIEDMGECEEISMLFGLEFQEGEIFINSAEESRGKTYYIVNCKVQGIDIEINDE